MPAPENRLPRVLRVVDKDHDDGPEELAYWLSRPPEERVAAVSYLTEQCWVFQGLTELPRLERTISRRALRS